MTNPTQLSYDLGFVIAKTNDSYGRPTRGDPHEFQKQIKNYIDLPGNRGQSAERMAATWLNSNFRTFDHREDIGVHRTWTEDQDIIKEKFFQLFRLIGPKEPKQLGTGYSSGGYSQPPHRNTGFENFAQPRLRNVGGVDLGENAGPLERLAKKDATLITSMRQDGWDANLPQVFASKNALINALQTTVNNLSHDKLPGSLCLSPNRLEIRIGLYLTTTTQKVFASQFIIQDKRGGWAIFEDADRKMTGRCIYAMTNSGNSQFKKGYHGWLGGFQGFSKKAIAHTEGNYDFHPRETQGESEGSVNNVDGPDTELTESDDGDGEFPGLPYDTTISKKSMRSGAGARKAGAASFHAGASIPNRSHSATGRSQISPAADVQKSYKRVRSVSPTESSMRFNGSAGVQHFRQQGGEKALSTFLHPNSHSREVSPLRQDAHRSAGPTDLDTSSTSRALETMIDRNLHTVMTANNIDACNVKMSDSLSTAIVEWGQMLDLAENSLDIQKRLSAPGYRENMNAIMSSRASREDMKKVYFDNNNKREALMNVGAPAAIAKHIFTHDHDLDKVPSLLSNWIASARNANDPVQWALSEDDCTDTASTRRPDTSSSRRSGRPETRISYEQPVRRQEVSTTRMEYPLISWQGLT
ncbi:uncharacterized protein KY384_008577 [Bacidia gigantensis]|uniref:uncharacterized protein n=1 Tax=Bacidia gigantensis TaxID=2732470 RepID=UPI001D03DF91|nr:uncharacterized protein KY384_008577 [Bacidia gigantensis]KAG8527147.1 hypothetical protein KY384_008577 [Bacidia gigantensis]